MSDSYMELAQLFKDRENPKMQSMIIGRVINPLPDLKVKVHDKVVLDKDNLLIAAHIYMHYKQIDVDKWLQIGDEVSLIPTTNQQIYYLSDKVVRL